jgi:phage tail sheath gpL-like
MSISFDQIPLNWRRKGVYAEIHPRYDRRGLYDYPTKVLIAGQMVTTGDNAGTAAALTPKPITRDTEAPAYFGQGSQAARMVAAFRKRNVVSELWAVGVADASGAVAAVRTITLTGSPTGSGTLALYIGGVRVPVGVSVVDTVTTIASAIKDAVNDLPALPFTATSAAGVVTLTAKNKGTCGSTEDIRLNYQPDEATPAGIAVAIAQSTAGATDPDVQTVLDAVENDWYTDIVVPWTDATNMVAVEAEMLRRYDAMTALDAHTYVGLAGTYATGTTWSALRNSAFVSAILAKGAPEPPWVWAASMAGAATRYLTDDPARQLGTIVLTGLKAPLAADRFTEEEQNLLLGKGLSTWDGQDDGTVVINRIVTTYQKTAAGIADDAWLDIMVPKTMSRIRFDWNTHVQLQYPRHKLAKDESPTALSIANADSVVTPRTMLATWIARAKKYHDAAWIQDLDYTKTNSSFEIDASDKNRLNGRQPVEIIGNLIVLACRLEFAA